MGIIECHEHVFLSRARVSKRKGWGVEVQDDSRIERPSTSRTEVKVERVNHFVRGDHG